MDASFDLPYGGAEVKGAPGFASASDVTASTKAADLSEV